jgi:D-amino peptidase
VRDLQVNGVSVGEGGMNALLAAWYGVPVVMVTGDDVAVEEQKVTAPNVRGVVVKRAINTRAVHLRSLTDTRREIQAAARESVAASRKSPPKRGAAYTVRMQFQNPNIPEVATAFREIRLVSSDAVEFTSDNMPDAYRMIRVLYRFINPD